MERGGDHLDGSMLVQYNCDKYDCDRGLVSQLEELVRRYPPNVYLAPYPQMDAMIAVAAPGRLLTLDEFDDERISRFVSQNLRR